MIDGVRDLRPLKLFAQRLPAGALRELILVQPDELPVAEFRVLALDLWLLADLMK